MTEIVVRADKKRVIVSKVVDGEEVARQKIDPDAKSARVRVGKDFGATEVEILQWAVKAQKSEDPVRITLIDPPKVLGHAIVVRGFSDTRESGVRYECDGATFVRCHLQGVPVTDLIDWTDGETLCCLDVDYHGENTPPSRDWLEGVVRTKLHPAPHAWHFSRGGGLHLFYTAAQPFTATELAAAAALRFKAIDPAAGVELKKIVRGPGDEALAVASAQATSVVLSAAGGKDQPEQSEIDEWLSARDMKVGGRYDHDKCPIYPTPGDKGTNSPVTVREDGVFCYDCQAKGRSLQRGKPGHGSWGAVLGSPVADDVASMIRGLCHWGHAKYVLVHKYGMVESIARIAYRAAVKAYHRDRPTEPLAAFVDGTPDTDNLTRVGTVWSTLDQHMTYPTTLARDIVASLPSVLDPETLKPRKATVAEFLAPKNLRDRGFPDVEVVHGFKAAQPFLAPPGTTQVPVVNEKLREANAVPRYVPKSKRMKEDKAWAVIHGVFPGLDRGLVRVMLCAFGSAQETRLGMLPLVFVHGSSGYGKSATCKIAAGIYGAQAGEAPFDANTERFRQRLHSAAQSGPCVVVNEILKDAANGQRKLTAKEALDPLLNLTPDSLSHQLYVGPIRFGRVPAVFLTEPKIPQYMASETQLARRIREWEVKGRKDVWKTTVPPSGVIFNDVHLMRLASREINDACDAIISEVVDEFFALPMTWDAMADRLGCKTLEESDEFDNPTARQREFFDLVCTAPEIASERQKRLYPGGFKKIDRACDTDLEKDLLALYTQFSDNGNWCDSRSLVAADWSSILKVDDNVNLDLTSDGVSVYVRFRVGPMKKPYKVNNAIAPVREVEPARS